MGDTGDVSMESRAARGPVTVPLAARRAARRGATAAVLAAALLLAGCSADDPPAPASTPDPTAAAPATEPGVSEEPSPSDAATAADDATAEPDVATPDPQGADDAATDGEDQVIPPEFSAPDAVLTEDAFDGPDLTLDSVDLTTADGGPAVELQVRGTGFPGWQAQYVDPAETPAGVAGAQAVLAVELVGVTAGSPAETLPGPRGQVAALELDEAAGGRLTLYLGLAQDPAPFRVHLQHTPLRLVVEVAG